MNEHRADVTVDLVVTGGTVVNASHRQPATVVVHEGSVRALLAPDAPVPAAADREHLGARGLRVREEQRGRRADLAPPHHHALEAHARRVAGRRARRAA